MQQYTETKRLGIYITAAQNRTDNAHPIYKKQILGFDADQIINPQFPVQYLDQGFASKAKPHDNDKDRGSCVGGLEYYGYGSYWPARQQQVEHQLTCWLG